MIEIYLMLGVGVAIAMLLIVHTKSYDEFCLAEEGAVDPQWRKILFSVSLIGWWPLFILSLFWKGKTDE